MSMIYMQDNFPSHPSRCTTAWLASEAIKDDRMMTWHLFSLDLNPVENLWAILMV